MEGKHETDYRIERTYEENGECSLHYYEGVPGYEMPNRTTFDEILASVKDLWDTKHWD